MCYEYWRFQRMRAEEDQAKQRTKEWLEKARSAKPVPAQQDEPVLSEEDQEAIEA